MKESYEGYEIEIVSEKQRTGLWWASARIKPPIRGIHDVTLAGPYKRKEEIGQGDSGFHTQEEAEASALALAKRELDR